MGVEDGKLANSNVNTDKRKFLKDLADILDKYYC